MKHAHNFRDLTGQRFGKMVVLGIDHRKGKEWFWKVQCDCGNTNVSQGGNIRGGKVKSCGSIACRWSRKPAGESALKTILKWYKRSASRRGLAFEIDIEYFRKLSQQPCHYCGREPFAVTNIKYINGQFTYNGLDRVDNSIGYVAGNLVPCCKQCNGAKSVMGRAEFLELVERIYRYSIEAAYSWYPVPTVAAALTLVEKVVS